MSLFLITLGVLGSWASVDAAPHIEEITLQTQLFEGSDLQIDDMKFGPGQYETLMRKGSLDNLWDLSQPIPYIIAEGFEDRVAQIIDSAINHWESNTCIRFQKYDSAPTQHHLRFFPGEKDACWSYIGRYQPYPWINYQNISIGSGYCEAMFVVAHEVGHAIGFYHEQSRFDRDEWITINTDNINPGDMNNFDLHSQDGTRGIEYDYYSVMQYDTTAASSTGYSTMVPKDILAYHLMGANKVGLTVRDRLMAQKMYQCEARDEQKCGKKCQNFGVLVSNDCTCACEPGVSGDLCENRDRPYIEARSDELVNFFDISIYHRISGFNLGTAEWGIQKVRVDAQSGCATLEYQGPSLDDCDIAYLLVIVGNDSTKYCGANLPSGKISSTNSEIKYIYVTTQMRERFSIIPGRDSC